MTDRRAYPPGYLLILANFWCTPLFAEVAENGGPASLAQLHDIVVPAAQAPWWPLAPGWYLLAGVLMLLAGWGVWRMRRRCRVRRYRVEALAELRALRRQRLDPQDAVAGILVLLKRTALAAYPRVHVASLSGEAWWRFLDLSGDKPRFAAALGPLAEEAVYARKDVDAPSASDLKRLYRAAGQWIRRHRPPNHPSMPVPATDDASGSLA